MKTNRPLPVRVELARGQALDCYLEHVCKANNIPAGTFMRHLAASADTTRYLLIAPTRRTTHILGTLTGITQEELRSATLAPYDGLAINLRGLDPTRQASYRTVAARGWAPGRGSQVCPQCLYETCRWDISWRLPTTTVCLRHETYLAAICPGCRRPFRDRTQPLRPVGPVTRCGNALGARGRYCPVEVADLEAARADGQCVARQSLQNDVAGGNCVTVLGSPASLSTLHEDMRSLTALLLHIATAAPVGTDLPHWSRLLRGEGSPVRSPRWAIAPPRDPVTRSRAMTSAVDILSSPDIDTAASLFSPWADLVPDTTDGFLGWVGDHTRATPNVTRLVMATHAPRRRLSRLLDASPPLTATLREIPPSISTPLYERYLARLFTSRPEAVRTFAAICIARTQSDIHTWADAAAALELVPDEAQRTVQTCTGGQVASPQEVMARIARVASELCDDPDHDTQRGRPMEDPSTGIHFEPGLEGRPGRGRSDIA